MFATTGVSTTLPVTTESSQTTTYYNDSRLVSSSGSYWACCKPSCAWPGKAIVTKSATSCAQDGFTAINENEMSSCDGGPSYSCLNQQPWNVSETLSYGYAGANIIVSVFFVVGRSAKPSFVKGQGESNWCCACYSLLVASGLAMGKEIIVQAIDTAYSSNNMFTLLIPGAGWHSSPNKCETQFSTTYGWGQQNGGVSNRSQCASLPLALQSGCYWRFDWFMNAINTQLRFKEVPCPAVLTNKTGCHRSPSK